MAANFNTKVNANLGTEHVVDVSDRLYKILLGVIGLLAISFLGWSAYQFKALAQTSSHEFNVSGEGKAYAKPDIAVISFGMHTEAQKSQDAVNQNNEKMNAVIKAVKDLGIEDKDIQTTLYNVNPVYDYPIIYQQGSTSSSSGMMAVAPMPVKQERTFSGYSVDQQVMVKIRNFDNINAVLDKATAAGANTVGQLSFTVDDMEKVRAEAREAAIANAKEKLDSLTKASGLRLGKLLNVSEGYSGYPQPMYGMGNSMKDSATVAPDIQAGQMEINMNVTLTYQVR